ncbi:DUF2336 domain-containing protein [Sphingobium sp. AP49]|uniref:DUF2336 domain-containing protein n=1 Tax=Sphingobium sp. AP49 TaxID=1144307 RepID=UPI0009DA9C8C|nr:DUF2336 domain-containing protein [Sphingobium sp. AP49]WHO37501.1 DUF2336 domain-containing protein [Sphingobium sp. AP49]
MTDSWPMAHVMAGMSAVPVGHAIDLAFFFPFEERSRHDALIAETRRHLGGCLTAIEAALRIALAGEPAVAAILARWPDPICWPTICAQPTLLGPALLAHMQMRAGISLLLRQVGHPDGPRPEDPEVDAILSPDDPEIGDAVIALSLAEGQWLATGGEQQPMRPDLPAEHFAELLWTAAACLAAVVQRAALQPDDVVMGMFERAGWALLAGHDEATGPIAAADQLVRRLGDGADSAELLGAALGQRRFLLFAALAARRLRLATVQVIDILVTGPVGQIATLCRALGGSGSDYRQLLLALRPIRPGLSDAAIVREADQYQALSDHHADAVVRALRAPAAFRAKLDHLRHVTAG